MKKIIIALTIILAFAQCYRFRDNAPLIMLNDDEYTYGSVQEAIEQVRIAYATIRSLGAYQRNFFIYGDIMSDDTEEGGTPGGDEAGYRTFDRYSLTSANGYISYFYHKMYSAIHNTNEILRRTIIDETAEENPMFINDDKVQYRAEAKFLRAFLYFDLVRVFGPVLYYDENNYTDTSSVTNRTIMNDDAEGSLQKEMVYDNIVHDLEQSMEVLQPSEYTFASPFAAKALLVKVLMYRNKAGDNTRALQLAQELIGDGSAILSIKYPDIFCEYFEHNIEGIIELDFERTSYYNLSGVTNGIGPIGCISSIDQSYRFIYLYDDDSENGLEVYSSMINYGLNVPTHNLVEQYEVNETTRDYDPRLQLIAKKENALFEGQPRDSAYTYGSRGRNNHRFFPIASESSATGYYNRKLEPRKGADDDGEANTARGINIILYRYSDLILLAAEAAFNEGDRELATSYVNVVRERARNSKIVDIERDIDGLFTGNYIYGQSEFPTNTSAAEITMDEIRLERRRELFCESQRFFDLVRWGIQDEVLGALTEDGLGVAINWQPHNKVLPFPISVVMELDGVLTQNPGY